MYMYMYVSACIVYICRGIDREVVISLDKQAVYILFLYHHAQR